ncbi:LAME_0G20274g1_1 [Lachancea meyersii CBS 8951]|uniref:Pectate lyase n=1 Tax=Lachancea meyersii CBS 8951 TaxID=1266667 RepID=A0A1G4KCJ2_9SACH|nr:LAME_0G20274g1_1 [Lachancea meyersii CBS 8951]
MCGFRLFVRVLSRLKSKVLHRPSNVNGVGAFGAEKEVIKHNGAGTVSLPDLFVRNFGKLYRSCGICKSMYEQKVIMDNISATSEETLM